MHTQRYTKPSFLLLGVHIARKRVFNSLTPTFIATLQCLVLFFYFTVPRSSELNIALHLYIRFTLDVKLQMYCNKWVISTIKEPFVVVLHSKCCHIQVDVGWVKEKFSQWLQLIDVRFYLSHWDNLAQEEQIHSTGHIFIIHMRLKRNKCRNNTHLSTVTKPFPTCMSSS